MRKGKLKVYCETSFWSWLLSKPSTNPDHAVKQAWTRKWWNERAPLCEIYVSPFVYQEAADGNRSLAALRKAEISRYESLAGAQDQVLSLAKDLLREHAIPEKETLDALHIATAAVYGMDILLTWNCKHMANLVTLPKTASVVAFAGYECPKILTPEKAMEVEYV
ncbi:MAG: type II toxin-antitoxin system VapC family toxin [Kiritimatiellae bacterium]|nr:type II toxin-antitoxin system VapC family toxin [Kiritimatiellia bacterium]